MGGSWFVRGDYGCFLTRAALSTAGRAKSKSINIFTTGYGMDVAGKEFVLRSGKHLLQKPFSPGELALAVRDCLETRRVPGKT